MELRILPINPQKGTFGSDETIIDLDFRLEASKSHFEGRAVEVLLFKSAR
jgi:hypothetical protein